MSVLENLKWLVIIYEIQRKPDLFELLRVPADRPDNPVEYPLPDIGAVLDHGCPL